MRIISGSTRGRRLATLAGRGIRPTPDRVREALFSILQHRLGGFSGKKVLDLFAGSGALALEALSRGAERALLVDRSPQAARVIRENIRVCGAGERAALVQADVLTHLSRLSRAGDFDLIFLDPPYRQGLIPPTLEAVDRYRLLAPNGLVSCESAREEDIPAVIGGLEKTFERVFGTTAIHLFRCQSQGTDLP